MRLPGSICFGLVLFLTGCANQGVVVQKETRPFPYYYSHGVEGIYTFLLRDKGGTIHRQMVTPDVFAQHAIGQYFNDLQPGARQASDSKTVRTALAQGTASAGRASSQRERSPFSLAHYRRQISRKRSLAQERNFSRPFAKKKLTSKKAVAKQSSGRKEVTKPSLASKAAAPDAAAIGEPLAFVSSLRRVR